MPPRRVVVDAVADAAITDAACWRNTTTASQSSPGAVPRQAAAATATATVRDGGDRDRGQRAVPAPHQQEHHREHEDVEQALLHQRPAGAEDPGEHRPPQPASPSGRP